MTGAECGFCLVGWLLLVVLIADEAFGGALEAFETWKGWHSMRGWFAVEVVKGCGSGERRSFRPPEGSRTGDEGKVVIL